MCVVQFRLATYSKKLPPKKRSLQIYSKFAVAKFGACSQYYQKCLAASALEWPDCNHQNITVTCCPLIQAKNAHQNSNASFPIFSSDFVVVVISVGRLLRDLPCFIPYKPIHKTVLAELAPENPRLCPSKLRPGHCCEQAQQWHAK